MVDRDIIYEMQNRFPVEFDATSGHKLRHPQDMQFAFSFNYYVIGVKKAANISELFDEIDTDKSGKFPRYKVFIGRMFFFWFFFFFFFELY